jgi:hypothetical protein
MVEPLKESEMTTPTTEIPVDVDVLREQIRRTYTGGSRYQEQEFVVPTGRSRATACLSRAAALACPGRERRKLRRRGEPVAPRHAEIGSVVLDLGSGAGTDLPIAAQMTRARRTSGRH